MAEETGQVETQPALGPMNHSEAVAYLSDAIEQSEAPPARDEKGKFTKTETEEATPEAEASDETAAADEQPETQEITEEAQPEPRKLKLKYKGEDREVDEAEAVELAQKGYDYQQKTATLAREREEVAAKVRTEQEAVRKQYETQLQVYQQLALKMADQEALTADLAKVAMEDPARALQLSLKRQQISETVGAIQAEQQKLMQQRAAEVQESTQKQAREAVDKLKERIPGWSNDLYGKILNSSVDAYGYSAQELNSIVDHRAIEVLNDARQWREYKAAKPTVVDKRVATVPKVQKPGTAEKPDAKAAKAKSLDEALKRTGSRTDAQALVLQMLQDNRL